MEQEIKRTTPLGRIIKLGADCRRCGKCCTFGAGFLVEGDIDRISHFLKLSKEELVDNCLEPVIKFNTTLHRPLSVKKGKQYGTCIFFNSREGCKIHPVKPLHCKISTCNEHGEDISVWFHLNYFVNKTDPESIRQWNVYLQSGGKNIPGGELSELVPDKKMLKKILSYEVLK